MATIKQKIRTIDAKALFRYCPKKKGSKYYALPLNSRAICRRVIKQEEDMEDCPVFDQFYKEIEKRTDGEGTFVVTDTTLTDKFLVMDFDDIFMPCSEDAKEPTKEKKKLLQENVKDIIENGFDIYPESGDLPIHMVAFDKSGNMSRKSRISFIDETFYDALNERLNLGMDFSKIPVQESKYYAYRGLYLSSSWRVEHKGLKITPETLVILQDERKSPYNPDRSITGYNYERNVNYITATDSGKQTDSGEKIWDFTDEQVKDLFYVQTPFDGVGFVSPAYTEYINESLQIKGSGATSFQIRLPFMKGMLHSVDVHGFLDEYHAEGKGKQHKYVDAFGIERDLSKAHIFVTESMFKGKKWLVKYLACSGEQAGDPMKFYCDMLEKFDHALYISGTNLPYGHSEYVHLSYQMINTLKFTEEQFQNILKTHTDFIEHPDEYKYDSGIDAEDGDADDENARQEKIESSLQNWERALRSNKNFSDDIYIRHELKNIQKGLLTKLAMGKLLVEGQSRYLCRDLLPLLVSMLEKPVDFFYYYLYYRCYLPTDGKDKLAEKLKLDYNSYYAFFRSPHLSRNEQYIMRRLYDADKSEYKPESKYEDYAKQKAVYDKYFGKLTGIVMIPRHSTLPLCLGGADFDGDLVSVVYNRDVAFAVAAGVFKEIPNVEYEYGAFYQRKLPVIMIPTTASEEKEVEPHVPYEHIKNTFSNRIGQISDAAIAIGQTEYGHQLTGNHKTAQKNEEEKISGKADDKMPSCEKCTILTGLEIDAAKNGRHPNLDSILGKNIGNREYIDFIHKFKRLRSEENYKFDGLKVAKTTQKEKDCIEVTAKDCKTIVRFYPQDFGTYINELPIAFMEAFKDFFKGKSSTSKGKKIFEYDANKEKESEAIEAFRDQCRNIFKYYFFYSHTLINALCREKNKRNYAMENLEEVIFRIYDPEDAIEIQTGMIPSLMDKIAAFTEEKNPVADMKKRINEEKWLFVPPDEREGILEKIIGNGFRADMLNTEEKGLLLDFKNQGYKNLWLILSSIESSGNKPFDEIRSYFPEKRDIIPAQAPVEWELSGLAREYYDNNQIETAEKMYDMCLREIKKIIEAYDGISLQNRLAVLDELTVASLYSRKVFWNAFGWKEGKQYITEKKNEEVDA